MKMSPLGRARLIAREGAKLHAYQDSIGVWTIGIGHTSAAGPPVVTKGLTIGSEECDRIFARDVVQYEDAVNKAVKVRINQNQFDALTSLCFNIGVGNFNKASLVRKLNSGDTIGAADGFLAWNRAGGKVLQGLVTRRAGERAQFLEVFHGPLPPPPDIETVDTGGHSPPIIVPKPEPGFWSKFGALFKPKV